MTRPEWSTHTMCQDIVLLVGSNPRCIHFTVRWPDDGRFLCDSQTCGVSSPFDAWTPYPGYEWLFSRSNVASSVDRGQIEFAGIYGDDSPEIENYASVGRLCIPLSPTHVRTSDASPLSIQLKAVILSSQSKECQMLPYDGCKFNAERCNRSSFFSLIRVDTDGGTVKRCMRRTATSIAASSEYGSASPSSWTTETPCSSRNNRKCTLKIRGGKKKRKKKICRRKRCSACPPCRE